MISSGFPASNTHWEFSAASAAGGSPAGIKVNHRFLKNGPPPFFSHSWDGLDIKMGPAFSKEKKKGFET